MPRDRIDGWGSGGEPTARRSAHARPTRAHSRPARQPNDAHRGNSVPRADQCG